MNIKALIYLLICLTATLQPTKAQADLSSKKRLQQDFQTMEKVLNEQDMNAMIQFFHAFIDEKAKINVSIESPTIPEALHNKMMPMDKQQFVNAFIGAKHVVEDYKVEIAVNDVEEMEGQTTSAYTMTERGLVKNPQDLNARAKPFTSRTKCVSVHESGKAKLVIKQTVCQTKVTFEEEI